MKNKSQCDHHQHQIKPITALHVKRSFHFLPTAINDLVSESITTFWLKLSPADLSARCVVDVCASLHPLAACGLFVMDCKPWCKHIALPREPHPHTSRRFSSPARCSYSTLCFPLSAQPFLLWSALHPAPPPKKNLPNAGMTFALQP